MKSIITLVALTIFSTMNAQEKLSKEEKERRDKNVEAGNPFSQYGYKAKVATLSKGKYLETHDLDSIVIIGTVKFNVNTNAIVGKVEVGPSVDAQPIGDVAGRWLSPDPMSEEYRRWSPYSFCSDSPLIVTDPDGRASIWLNQDGQKVVDEKTGEYTEYATEQDKQFGDALKNSGAEGQKQFDALVKSPTEITVTFHEDKEGESFFIGLVTPTKTSVDKKTGKETLVAADLEIWIGRAQKLYNEINSKSMDQVRAAYSGDSETMFKNYGIIKDNKLSFMDYLTSVFGHEIKHTDQKNFTQMRAEQKGEYTPTEKINKEIGPENVQQRILIDLSN